MKQVAASVAQLMAVLNTEEKQVEHVQKHMCTGVR